jgi:hypothetical protein
MKYTIQRPSKVYPNWYFWFDNLPNELKIYQMAVKYVCQLAVDYTNLFHSKALQNLPKFGFLL